MSEKRRKVWEAWLVDSVPRGRRVDLLAELRAMNRKHRFRLSVSRAVSIARELGYYVWCVGDEDSDCDWYIAYRPRPIPVKKVRRMPRESIEYGPILNQWLDRNLRVGERFLVADVYSRFRREYEVDYLDHRSIGKRVDRSKYRLYSTMVKGKRARVIRRESE